MKFKEAIAASPHGRAEIHLGHTTLSNQTECSIVYCLCIGVVGLEDVRSNLWDPTTDISGYAPGSLMEHSKYQLVIARKYLREVGVL